MHDQGCECTTNISTINTSTLSLHYNVNLFLCYERQKPIIQLSKRSDKTHRVQIDCNQKIGFLQRMGNGIELFSPCDENKIYAAKSFQPYLTKYLFNLPNLMERLKFVETITYQQQSNPNLIDISDPLYTIYAESIRRLLEQSIISSEIQSHSCAYKFAKEAYKQTTNLQHCNAIIMSRINALVLMSSNVLLSNHINNNIYKCIKILRKASTYYGVQGFSKCHVQQISCTENRLKWELTRFSLQYNMKKNVITYTHAKYNFHYKGYKLLKLKKKQGLADKIKRQRKKACKWCKKLVKGNKKCSQCQQIFYCSKRCQKKHWNTAHRLECSI